MLISGNDLRTQYLHVDARKAARYCHVLKTSGALSFATAPQFKSAYHRLLGAEAGRIHRLFLDLRDVSYLDMTGMAVLLELGRDAGRRSLDCQIVDKVDRPLYRGTGLADRFQFVNARMLEALER